MINDNWLIYVNEMQIKIEKNINYKLKNRLWPLSRAYDKWRVQMTLLVSINMKLKIQT